MLQSLRPLHMIFTRVEAEYSPRNKSEFQVYYHSPALSAQTIEWIQNRVESFNPEPESLIRQQFFTLPDGQVVMTSTRNIKGSLKINDRYRPYGIFLAHCLVFSVTDFAKTLNNPFKIFDNFIFLTDAETMVEQFNQKTGNEPKTIIQFDPYSPTCNPDDWFPDIVKLVGLALKAKKLQEKNLSLAFIGSQEQIVRRIRAVLELVPVKYRLQCTFDTFAEGENLKAGNLWAVCGAARRDLSFIEVDVQSGEVTVADETVDSNDLYLTWLINAQKNRTSLNMKYAPTFQELSEAFREHRSPIESGLNETASVAFYDIYQKEIHKNLGKALSQATSPEIGQLLIKYSISRLGKKSILEIAAVGSLPPRKAAEIVKEFVLAQAPNFIGINAKAWKGVAHLGQKAEDSTLILWAAILGKEENLRLKTLESIKRTSYCASLDLLGNPIEPLYLMKSEYMTEFFDKLVTVQKRITADSYAEMLEWVFKWKSEHLLGTTIQLVFQLNNLQLYRVEQLLKNSKGKVSEEFIRAVKTQRSKLGKKPSIITRLIG